MLKIRASDFFTQEKLGPSDFYDKQTIAADEIHMDSQWDTYGTSKVILVTNLLPDCLIVSWILRFP